jgi:type IV pilus assembly protein PilW
MAQPTPRTPFARRTLRQHGFTLVELLVGVALGLLVMIALIAVYLNVSRTNSEMARTNSIIENGRFAVDVLNEDLMHVGFWGGHIPHFDDMSLRSAPTDVPGTTSYALGPCHPQSSWDNDYRHMLVGIGVETYNGVPPGCSAVVTDRKPDTDVLVVRHAESCAIGDSGCDAYNSAGTYFQPSFCETQKTTQVAAGSQTFILATLSPVANFTYQQRTCVSTALAPIRRFVQNIYYVKTYAVTSGDNIPTLWRASYRNGAWTNEAMIEGIEYLKVYLGIDGQGRCGAATDYTQVVDITDNVTPYTMVRPSTCARDTTTASNNTMPVYRGDGVPEAWWNCGSAGCTATQLRDAVAAKVYVLARAKEASPNNAFNKTFTLGPVNSASTTFPTTGVSTTETFTVSHSSTADSGDANIGYKRQVFQTTTRFLNVAGRRETP